MKPSFTTMAAGALVLLCPALVLADAPVGHYAPYLSIDSVIQDQQTGYRWDRAFTEAVTLNNVKCPLDSGGNPTGGRVPTVKELATLLDNEPRKVIVGTASVDVHIDQSAFPRTPPEKFWTSSVTPDGRVFLVDFRTGEIEAVAPAGVTARVRCVARTL
jgi:hypothetical protein